MKIFKVFVFFFMISVGSLLAQVTTLPNSIGIGQNTNAAVPLHIKKNGEVARFEGTSLMFHFMMALR